MDKKITVADFSPHLFWDVDSEKFDLNSYKEFMIGRVLEYGRLEDWQLLKKLYGKKTIKKVCLNIEYLEAISLSFLSTIFKIDESEFRCYKENKSHIDSEKIGIMNFSWLI